MSRPKIGKHIRHGSKLYARYNAMVTRCTNPLVNSYHRYGGRGVTVCKEWLESYDAFADWCLANGYIEELQLDKDILSAQLGISPPIYSPETCMFVSHKTNVLHSTSTKFDEAFVKEVVTDFDSKPDTFAHREAINKKYGLTKKQLGCMLARRANKKLGRGTSGVLTPEDKQTIIALRAEGFGFPVIAEKLNLNYNTCKAWHAKYKRGEDPQCPLLKS